MENIGQGVNQLRNIPSMPEDDLFSTDWIPPIVSAGRTNGTSVNTNGFLNGAINEDPFGDPFDCPHNNGFGNSFQHLKQLDDPFKINNNFLTQTHNLTLSAVPASKSKVDSWASFETSNKNDQATVADDFVFQAFQFDGHNGKEIGVSTQRTNVKTPENFLGENSSLVNLDNLMGQTSFQPSKTGMNFAIID